MKNIYEQKMPKFEPFDKIIVGSNEVTCKYLVRISGYAPLIIGKGKDEPIIWMYAINKNEVYPIIVGNVSLTDSIVLDVNRNFHSVKVAFKDTQGNVGKTFLKAEYSDSEFRIMNMDLRFLGIDIRADEDVLIAGHSKIAGRIAHDVEVFVGG